MSKQVIRLGNGQGITDSFQDDLVVNEITNLHGEIAMCLKIGMEKAIRIGELLTEQKGKLGHGYFGLWIANKLPFTDRTARNYMKVYAERDRLKTETISVLTDAYKLLATKAYHGECSRPLDSFYSARESLLLLHGCELDNQDYHSLFEKAQELTRICFAELQKHFEIADTLQRDAAITEICWLSKVSKQLQDDWAIENIRCSAKCGSLYEGLKKELKELKTVTTGPGGVHLMIQELEGLLV